MDAFRTFDWSGMKERLHTLTCLATGLIANFIELDQKENGTNLGTDD